MRPYGLRCCNDEQASQVATSDVGIETARVENTRSRSGAVVERGANMRTKIVCAALASVLMLSACSVAPLNFTPANVAASSKRHNAALVSTNVTVASKDEATGKLNTAGAEADVASLWKSTLDDALVRMAMFRDDSPNKLSLIFKILELDLKGLGSETVTTARYELVDRNTGQTIFSTDVNTNGHASDYVGVNRSRKSANRSVQANIEEFLRKIEAANLSSSQLGG